MNQAAVPLEPAPASSKPAALPVDNTSWYVLSKKKSRTLCFPREMWQRRPFRNLRAGYDSWFLRDHNPNIVRVCAAEHYIVLRHGGNTWTKMGDGDEAGNFLRGRPIHSKPIEAIVDPRDQGFYHSLW